MNNLIKVYADKIKFYVTKIRFNALGEEPPPLEHEALTLSLKPACMNAKCIYLTPHEAKNVTKIRFNVRCKTRRKTYEGWCKNKQVTWFCDKLETLIQWKSFNINYNSLSPRVSRTERDLLSLRLQ